MSVSNIENMVNPELRKYIEKNVFPVYANNEEAHQLPHIMYVIKRALQFAQQFSNIDGNMCYAMAAYHDIAHYIDKDHHEILSAQFFMDSEAMKHFFTDEERVIIQEAIEDHRASLPREPRSDYGKILSSADRSVDINVMIKRSIAYTKKHFPEMTPFEGMERVYHHIQQKYGKQGYAKTYVKDEEMQAHQKELESLLANPGAFVNRYLDVGKMYPPIGMDRELLENLLGKKKMRKLEELHRRKYEVKFYQSGVSLERPFMIEFTGTPRTGKTTMIKALQDFLQKAGFRVAVQQEFTRSSYYVNVMLPKAKKEAMSIGQLNLEVMEKVYQELANISKEKWDIILVDRGINDRQIWNALRYEARDLTNADYEKYQKRYLCYSQELVDMLVVTQVDAVNCMKRDFASCIALEKRHFLSEENIRAWNKAMQEMLPLLKENVGSCLTIQTGERSIESCVIQVADAVLEMMRQQYVTHWKC